jgi:hypothetical protein
MTYLFITPLILFILYFLIEDIDIRKVCLGMSCIMLFDILTYYVTPSYLYYIRSCYTDVLTMYISILLVNKTKTYSILAICLFSIFMNMYEDMSYYQTIFFQYRDTIQFVMMQLIFIILLYKARWRKLYVTRRECNQG